MFGQSRKQAIWQYSSAPIGPSSLSRSLIGRASCRVVLHVWKFTLGWCLLTTEDQTHPVLSHITHTHHSHLYKARPVSARHRCTCKPELGTPGWCHSSECCQGNQMSDCIKIVYIVMFWFPPHEAVKTFCYLWSVPFALWLRTINWTVL